MTSELFEGSLTDVRGLKVGHATDSEALTGCTVVLCGRGVAAGGVVRGLAPGTRETALLRPGTLVQEAHGILLTGGSAFGLAAADGVMRYLEEQGVGYDAGVKVPIVPGAVLFDLDLGEASARPDAHMGYEACQSASSKATAQGNVGAGTGATVGKLMGIERATKSGLGMASLKAGRLVVASLAVVNAFGDVIDPASGEIIAGARSTRGDTFIDTSRALQDRATRTVMAFKNTVIGVVATNARLDDAHINHLAAAAHDGLARTIRPVHTLYDGDTFFSLATGHIRAHHTLVTDMAATATARAILNAVWSAEEAAGLPSAALGNHIPYEA
ncbi:MAG: P1 family peptidase [Chloroflexota bacterium]|nr:P1 family peptidase [Chloroflexota bacterium]